MFKHKTQNSLLKPSAEKNFTHQHSLFLEAKLAVNKIMLIFTTINYTLKAKESKDMMQFSAAHQDVGSHLQTM